MRSGIAFSNPEPDKGGFAKTLLRGSARVLVTMGMPAFLYRVWYLGHGIAGMRRNILHFVGFRPGQTRAMYATAPYKEHLPIG